MTETENKREKMYEMFDEVMNNASMYDYCNSLLHNEKTSMYYDAENIAIRKRILRAINMVAYNYLSDIQLLRLISLLNDPSRFKDHIADAILKECNDVYSNDVVSAVWRYVCKVKHGYKTVLIPRFNDTFVLSVERLYIKDGVMTTLLKVKGFRRGECLYKVNVEDINLDKVKIEMELMQCLKFIEIYPNNMAEISMYPIFASTEVIDEIKVFFNENKDQLLTVLKEM